MAINSVTASTCADTADLLNESYFGHVLEKNVSILHICVERQIGSHTISEIATNKFLLTQRDIQSIHKQHLVST